MEIDKDQMGIDKVGIADVTQCTGFNCVHVYIERWKQYVSIPS